MEYQNPKIADLESCSAIVVIELDPLTPDYPERPPAPLAKTQAGPLIEAIAADLGRQFRGLDQVLLTAAAALYDQTELLQPGFPLLRALDDIARGTLVGQGFQPQILALGGDHFPIAHLNPKRAPGSGPLFLLPLSFLGRPLAISSLANNFENQLLNSVTASEETIYSLQTAFGIQPVNVSYATVMDLCALLKIQLENSHFEPLWELLDQALFQRCGYCAVTLPTGNRFVQKKSTVYTPFFTFDDFAAFGPGQALELDELAAHYTQWSQFQRQYTVSLAAFGLTVQPLMANEKLFNDDFAAALDAGRNTDELNGDFLIETVFDIEDEIPVQRHITIHQSAELGPMVYTVAAANGNGQIVQVQHFYPLTPQGINAIVDHLKQSRLPHQIVTAPELAIDPEDRALQPYWRSE